MKLCAMFSLLLVASTAFAGSRDDDPSTRPHELLLATAWVQRSAEFEANTRSLYAAAIAQLDELLALEGAEALPFSREDDATDLPPAVILDIDETVLNNVAYQARLIEDGTVYESESWKAWCDEAKAPAIAGALAFCRAAVERGVDVFYVSNRKANVEEPTRRNLLAEGFPVATPVDHVLLRGEREEWTSDKASRLAHVAATHRVLMLFGDNIGDFGVHSLDPSARAAFVAKHDDWWGERWFMLPNPMYGSWHATLLQGDFGLEAAETIRRLRESLDSDR